MLTREKVDDPKIIFFLSAGRCSTQWWADMLDEIYRDMAVAKHEPLGPDYHPVEFYRDYGSLEKMKEVPGIRKHLGYISKKSRKRHYIETGWPSYAFVPLLVKEFGEMVKIFHLLRNPVYTAISLTTHDTYNPDHIYYEKAMLKPHHHVFLAEYKDKWQELSQYEKNLFQWTELALYAEEIREMFPEIPFMRARKEDLFGNDNSEIKRLLGFMELPLREEIIRRKGSPRDKFKVKTLTTDWKIILNHPRILETAKRFGYELEDVDDLQINHRYFK